MKHRRYFLKSAIATIVGAGLIIPANLYFGGWIAFIVALAVMLLHFAVWRFWLIREVCTTCKGKGPLNAGLIWAVFAYIPTRRCDLCDKKFTDL